MCQCEQTMLFCWWKKKRGRYKNPKTVPTWHWLLPTGVCGLSFALTGSWFLKTRFAEERCKRLIRIWFLFISFPLPGWNRRGNTNPHNFAETQNHIWEARWLHEEWAVLSSGLGLIPAARLGLSSTNASRESPTISAALFSPLLPTTLYLYVPPSLPLPRRGSICLPSTRFPFSMFSLTPSFLWNSFN